MFFLGCIDENNDDDNDLDSIFNKNWVTIIVDNDGWVGIDPMIAVDTNNNPHIAYYDQGNRDLKYAYYDGANWNVETVDSTGNIGEEAGIDIDSNGKPHISYEDHTNSALKYATKNNGKWAINTIDSINADIEAMSTSLIIDSEDNIHISYSFGLKDSESFEGYRFRYAYYNGSKWTTENIREEGSDMIIDVDSSNNPHISFKGMNNDQNRIMYATKNNDEWNIEVVDKNVDANDGDTGIAVQKNGTPHIIYHDYNKGLIKYASKNNDQWTTSIIENNQDNQEGIKIDVDSENNVHVVYSNVQKNSDDGYLVYAKKQGSNWIKENVYNMDNPAITVGSDGSIHIAHNKCVEKNPLDYCPDYTGDETEIEILMYSTKNMI